MIKPSEMLAAPPPHSGQRPNGHPPPPNGHMNGHMNGHGPPPGMANNYMHGPPVPGLVQGGLMVGGMAGAAEHARRMQDLDTLCQIISQWNANRLDLFALTLPNEVGQDYILP